MAKGPIAELQAEKRHAIGFLCQGDHHGRLGRLTQIVITRVGDDADDAAGSVFKFWSDTFADFDGLADWILVLPITFCNRLIDERDTGRAIFVLIVEVATAEDGDFEDRKIAGRDGHPLRIAGVAGVA